MNKLTLILLVLVTCITCKEKPETKQQTTYEKNALAYQTYTKAQEAIIDNYVYNCADTYSYRYEHLQYQQCLDEGLKKDSTISYLWQQKAMPYFKARKYEVGMRYVDKAVNYNRKEYLPYRAFIKCIFAKTYEGALKDFEEIKAAEGNQFVMDHTYNFYIALCHLQLNRFEKAERIFKKDIEEQVAQWGEDGYLPLDLFYYSISLYEQQKWEEAITQFDKCLETYPLFSDAMYYKSICLRNIGKPELAYEIYKKARLNGEKGNTVNESNSVYELYPYQISWN